MSMNKIVIQIEFYDKGAPGHGTPVAHPGFLSQKEAPIPRRMPIYILFSKDLVYLS